MQKSNYVSKLGSSFSNMLKALTKIDRTCIGTGLKFVPLKKLRQLHFVTDSRSSLHLVYK